MTDYQRGVVVDYQGYFLAAIQWDASGPPPNLNTPRHGRKRMKPEDVKTILTDVEAIADPLPNGRWNKKTKTWDKPNVQRWYVTVRRDKPDLGTFAGARMVWPDRLPQLPAYQRWVDVGPPACPGKRPVWSFSKGVWLVGKRVAVIDADGLCRNFVVSLSDDDVAVPKGGGVLHEPEVLTRKDETGREVPLQIGDTVDLRLRKKDQAVLGKVVSARRPHYRRYPLPVVRRVFEDYGLWGRFEKLLFEQGFFPEDIQSIGGLGLGIRVVRDFLHDEGYTPEQAFKKFEHEFKSQDQFYRKKIAHQTAGP